MATFNLEDLLPESTPLPYFKPGDIIEFPKEHTLHPDRQVMQLSDLIFQDLFQELVEIDSIYDKVKISPEDERLLRERLFGKKLLTGLSIIDYRFVNKGYYDLKSGEKINRSYGWLGKLSISQALPGITEPVSAEFDYISTIYRPNRVSKNGVVTEMDPIFRTGPFNAQTSKIGEINHPELQDLRRRSKRIGAGSMAVGVNKTTFRPTGSKED